jgi:hypothetical protein
MNKVFKASRMVDLFTPNEVILGEKGITFKINKLIGGTESFVFYQDISGVEIDRGMFFASIRVLPRARQEMVIKNFSNSDAQEIKRLVMERV